MKRMRIFAVMVAFVFASAEARADLITISQYDVNQAGGGVNIQANYDLTGTGITCDPANVRWLQRILLTDGTGAQKNDVPGYPSGNFIDPQPMQGGGTFDNNPWYDFTYNTAADRTAGTNQQNGAGAFYTDSPSGWGPFKPITFSATLELVCINSADCTGVLLGGFTWGFSINMAGTVTKIPIGNAPPNDATATVFNDALQLGPKSFSKWRVRSVPEPSSVALMGLGLAGAGMAAARRRRAARAVQADLVA